MVERRLIQGMSIRRRPLVRGRPLTWGGQISVVDGHDHAPLIGMVFAEAGEIVLHVGNLIAVQQRLKTGAEDGKKVGELQFESVSAIGVPTTIEKVQQDGSHAELV